MVKQDPVLEHETRRFIYNHIMAHPGVSYSILKRVLNLTDGTLRYHLDFLKRAKKICCDPDGGKRNYFPYGNEVIMQKLSVKNESAIKLNRKQEIILELIKKFPGISQKELTRKARMNRFTIYHNINALMDYCLVRRIVENKNICYEFLSDDLMEFEIIKKLMEKLLKGEIDEQTYLELKKQIE